MPGLPKKQLKPDALAVAYASAITLDVAEHDTFLVAALTGDVSFSFAHAASGQRGVVWVLQDGVGGWRAGFVAPGTSIIREPAGGILIASGANAITRLEYRMHLLGGVDCIDIDVSARSASVKVVTYLGAQVTLSGDRVITT